MLGLRKLLTETILKEKIFETHCGNIHYWINKVKPERLSLIFLPGLTANHKLFEKQIEYFKDNFNIFVWDPPGHSQSWPFDFNFNLKDSTIWLNEILSKEKISSPVLIGQSMGGYVSQAFMELFPDKPIGFVSVDSGPLQKSYISNLEILLLKKMEPIYYYFPWKLLIKVGPNNVAESEYGRNLMLNMMLEYDGDKKRYSKLIGHGFKILAQAIEKDLDYKISCPALLICGTKDKAGSAKNYNKKWHQKSGFPIIWLKGAGHNSNTDSPEEFNLILEEFLNQIKN